MRFKEASYYERLDSKRVKCSLCPHNCLLTPDHFGKCGARKNRDGTLYSEVYGHPVAMSVDPVEKKPLFNFFPGSATFSICTIGCNLDCPFCQNYHISQNPKGGHFSSGDIVLPEAIVNEARIHKCKILAYTYTEPSIYFEYALDVSKIAKENGIYNIFVTNGYLNEKPLSDIKGYLDAANVDLKGFSDRTYKKLGGRVKPVLDTISRMKKFDVWVEITTLIVPGINDTDEELKEIAKFIAGCGREIPWHISRFHPDYKYTEAERTPLPLLKHAYDIGKSEGIKYIYLGNVAMEGFENTYCYNCNSLIIERHGFNVSKNLLTAESECPKCSSPIHGVF